MALNPCRVCRWVLQLEEELWLSLNLHFFLLICFLKSHFLFPVLLNFPFWNFCYFYFFVFLLAPLYFFVLLNYYFFPHENFIHRFIWHWSFCWYNSFRCDFRWNSIDCYLLFDFSDNHFCLTIFKVFVVVLVSVRKTYLMNFGNFLFVLFLWLIFVLL